MAVLAYAPRRLLPNFRRRVVAMRAARWAVHAEPATVVARASCSDGCPSGIKSDSLGG